MFSLIYFGFWRKGCVCAVGSLQNTVAAVADPTFEVPLVVLAFFVLPLAFALFFGRVFCASVCPLGAIQEMVAVRPAHVPKPIEQVLALIPYLYLGLAVLSVATGAGFLICRYDPFVGFFRQGASFNMLVLGGVFLIAGVFIGRPYCRFFCPYGVLLGWMSRFAKWHASITPGECVQCRLCEEACPYGAIHAPSTVGPPVERRQGVRRLAALLLATPLIVGSSAWAGAMTGEMLARLHPTVNLAERFTQEERGVFQDMTLDTEAFRSSKKSVPQLYAEVDEIRRQFRRGSAWLGAFFGIVVSAKLLGLSVVRRRGNYEPDRQACLSCGRCFAYCPVEAEPKASTRSDLPS